MVREACAASTPRSPRTLLASALIKMQQVSAVRAHRDRVRRQSRRRHIARSRHHAGLRA